MNAQQKTQLVVIGGGPGGYPAAFYAADMGMEVTLVDMNLNPGGVCLYRGCIPSKALLHVAKLINEANEASAWGLTFEEPTLDIDKLREWKDSVVGKLTGGLGQLSKARKINFIRGRATFASEQLLHIEQEDGTQIELSFDTAIIATGSSPIKIPSFPESPRVLDSTTALELPDVPEKLLIVGGGYIGLELGQAYAAFGSAVSVVEMLPQLMGGADKDLSRILLARLKKQFDQIMVATKVMGMKEVGEEIEVDFENDKSGSFSEKYDRVLVSVGRRPNSTGIGLENTSVVVSDRGFIDTNEQCFTAAKGISAIGDVVGQPMLAHKATAEGKAAVDAILGKKTVFAPYAIPAVVFTDPELAWTGLTENEAKEKGLNFKVGKFPWAASGRATTLGRNDGATKVIADAESGRILGVGIAGPGAGELIASCTLAIEMGATLEDLALTIHPHPTLSETVMEAAEVALGHGTHFKGR